MASPRMATEDGRTWCAWEAVGPRSRWVPGERRLGWCCTRAQILWPLLAVVARNRFCCLLVGAQCLMGSCIISVSYYCHVILPLRSPPWFPIGCRIKFRLLSLAFTALLFTHLSFFFFFSSLFLIPCYPMPFTGLHTHPGLLPLGLVYAWLQTWTLFFSVSICTRLLAFFGNLPSQPQVTVPLSLF